MADAQPVPHEDPASYLHVELHLGAHRQAVRVSPAEWEQAWKDAEAYWDEQYRELPAQLAAVTRAKRAG